MILIRVPATFFAIFAYMLCAAMIHVFVRDLRTKRKIIINYSHRLSCVLLFLAGFRIKRQAVTSDQKWPEHPFLILCNHMTYMDVPIILAQCPTHFVTSVEVRDTPIIGHFCRLSCCIFVERRKKRQIPQEIAQIKEILDSGSSVCIFPEGTSTDGEAILPFRNTLLQSVVGSNVTVLPLCIRYLRLNGKKLTKKTRDYICWYGDMTFFPHFIRMLSSWSIDGVLLYGKRFVSDESMDRKALAGKAYEIIHEMHSQNIDAPTSAAYASETSIANA